MPNPGQVQTLPKLDKAPMYSQLSLAQLPDLTLTRMLEYVDIKAYIALSLTCKALHNPANCFLYRYRIPEWNSRMKTGLCKSIVLNPSNARFLQEFEIVTFKALKAIWENKRVRLSTLTVNLGDKDDHPWNELPTPRMKAQKLRVKSTSGFRRLLSIPGLDRLELHAPYAMLTPTSIRVVLDKILFPALRHLALTLCDSNVWDCHIIPGDHFTGLRTIQINVENEDSEDEGDIPILLEDVTWEYLRVLIKRKVHLRFYKWYWIEKVVSLFPTVHKFADDSVAAAIEWLIQGEREFQLEVDNKSRCDIDIRNLLPSERDQTLEIAKSLPLSQNCGWRISIDNSFDCSLLPPETSHLDLYFAESVHSTFVPKILNLIRGRLSVAINVYGRHHRGTHLLESGALCTASKYTVHLADNVTPDASQYTMTFFIRRREVDQYIWQSPGFPAREIWRVGDYETKDMTEILQEIRGWFDLNENLKDIELRIWGGRPWGFYFGSSSDYIWSDNEHGSDRMTP